jgi:hypothetical protein
MPNVRLTLNIYAFEGFIDTAELSDVFFFTRYYFSFCAIA